MKKHKLVFLTAIFCTLVSLTAFAQGVSYDFDRVEVSYGAEFTAYPVNITEESWVTRLAGGTDKPITVLYGVVELKKDGVSSISEEFIKITGENGSERFLLNSGSYGSVRKSFFWSAKKLVDNTVVKDFTEPVLSVTLYNFLNENRMILQASDDGEKAGGDFWSDEMPAGYYEADMSTLVQSGSLFEK
jgi:hypothetical protein